MTGAERDDAPRAADLWVATALLTRLPLPVTPDWSRGARAAWAYPLAGLVAAVVAAAIGSVVGWVAAPPVAVLATVVALAMVTGALHEDGLADTADGLWGGHDRARRLEIMRDSRIGSYGVLALVFAALLKVTALWATGAWVAALLAAAVLSRAVMVVVMASLPHARADGLARLTGRAPSWAAWGAMLVAMLVALALTGWAAFAALLAAGGAAVAVALLARARIGGQTGDILGATQQVAEVAVLVVLSGLI